MGLGSVHGVDNGTTSVLDWYTTSLDFKDSLESGEEGEGRHLWLCYSRSVSDVVNSFTTIEKEILDRVPSRLYLPSWFRKSVTLDMLLCVFFPAAGLGSPWTPHGGVPHGGVPGVCLFVVMSVMCCSFFFLITPQLYADSLKCV